MKKLIVVTLLLVAGFAACKHEVLTPPKTDPTPPDTLPGGSTGVCFTKDVLPIFQSYCAKEGGCHDAKSQEGEYVLDNYDNILKRGITPGNASNSKIYKVIITTDPGDVMPPPGNLQLTQAQKELIKKWIDEGAKNTACTSTCDPSLFTYSGFVQPLLQKSCNGCHSGTNASGGINLTVFSTVKTMATNGKLYGSIAQMSGYIAMPQGGSKLSDCEITQVKKWIDAGAPQN